ncbi:MAG TPA: DUF1552 domain-containing protein [Polyangia bacterium]|nr:DUF1552 domain-containing protein [Polyangia bacterium]
MSNVKGDRIPMVSLSRRQFTTSVGAGLLLSPFLRSLRAHAAPTKRPKRVLLFCTMGTSPPLWTPTNVAGESSFTFTDATQPLSAAKDSIVLVDGLVSGNPGDNHGSPDGLSGLGFAYSGQPAMISVDQFIGDSLMSQGINRPIATLLLGANTNSNGGRTMFNRQNNLPTISSPLSAYNTIFGGAAPAGGTGMTSAASTANLLRRRKSILDLVNGEINGLRQIVGSDDRAKLDAHLDSLRQVENRLTQMSMPSSTTGGGASACMKPTTVPADDATNVLQTNLVHMDLITSAFACDITRVAAVQFGSDQSMNVDLADQMLQGEEHGGFIHGGGPTFTNLIKLEQWLSQRFVDLITKLKSIPEADGSGTLYDNTLMVWARDMGDAVNHNQQNMRFVFAGATGYLKTNPAGRYLHFDGTDPNSRHERALLSICDAMGITSDTGFGDPKLAATSKMPLPGLAA